MTRLVTDRLDDLRKLCEKHAVRRLEVFGSAMGGAFKPGTSDLDFLVQFSPQNRHAHRKQYFGLWNDLRNLFGCEIDLLETHLIENPYLKAEVDRSRTVVYAA